MAPADLASAPLLAALALGHVLADFVFQTPRMVAEKTTARGLMRHGGLVLLCHVAALAPLWPLGAAPRPLPTLAILLGVAALHVAIDAAKARATRKWGDGLAPFLADQGLHAATLLVAWLLLSHLLGATPPLRPTPHAFTVFAVLATAYALNVMAASVVVGLVLKRVRLDPPSGTKPAGRYIGILERLLILSFVLVGHWAAIGFTLAAKSVARFPEFKDGESHFAEYFLVGTLASVAFAIATGVAVKLLLGW